MIIKYKDYPTEVYPCLPSIIQWRVRDLQCFGWHRIPPCPWQGKQRQRLAHLSHEISPWASCQHRCLPPPKLTSTPRIGRWSSNSLYLLGAMMGYVSWGDGCLFFPPSSSSSSTFEDQKMSSAKWASKWQSWGFNEQILQAFFLHTQ